jgi:alpha-1,2-mannosyltransferase
VAEAIIRAGMSAADVMQPWSRDGRSAHRPGLIATALIVVGIVWTLSYITFSLADGLLAWDVRFAYLPAAEAVLDGRSPYPELDDPILDEQKGYVYPPQLLVALLPFTPLPVDVAAVLASLAMLGVLLVTVFVLGVRDLRCYGALLLWMPTMSGVLFANVSIPLAFALAVAWRYRDAVKPSAAALGLAVSAKLLLWPMLVWMAATSRARTAIWAVAVGAGVTIVAWAALGFDGLTSYPDLLERLSEIQSENSYSLVGMAAELGLPVAVGHLVALASGVGLLVWCVALGRRGDDLRSFTCAVAGALVLSPILWLHYLVLLVVPLALARPRFSPLWLLPVLLVVSPRPGYAEGIATFLPGIVAALVLATLLVRQTPRSRALAEAPA